MPKQGRHAARMHAQATGGRVPLPRMHGATDPGVWGSGLHGSHTLRSCAPEACLPIDGLERDQLLHLRLPVLLSAAHRSAGAGAPSAPGCSDARRAFARRRCNVNGPAGRLL